MAKPRSSTEVRLPSSVENALRKICQLYSLPPPDPGQRKELAALGEETALRLLQRHGDISDHISIMENGSDSSESATQLGPKGLQRPRDDKSLPLLSNMEELKGHRGLITPRFEKPSNDLFDALAELEFRKLFMILSYCGKKQLKDVMDVSTMRKIQTISNLSMTEFESMLWRILGRKCIEETDRLKFQDWDSGKTYVYRCHVASDGTCIFKGPNLDKKTTHLQRVLGDDNVLDVRFAEDDTCNNDASVSIERFRKIAKEGICVGLRRYQFFVFKDGGKEERRKCPTSSSVKSYFVRMESNASIDKKNPYILSNKSIHEARCIFMHVHTVSSVAKYMVRLSLILSKTMKLDIDLASVRIERIKDETCKDENGKTVYNEDGKSLIHTDGTGFISEDLALRCPKHIFKGKPLHLGVLERSQGCTEDEKCFEMRKSSSQLAEPPLLMQCRLFHNGSAIKGTLLVNKELPPRTIQIRPSMVKVESDPKLLGACTIDSLEIVSTSNPPSRTTCLSRNLIALLNYGGVPNEYFMDLLSNALKEAQDVRYDKRSALTVSLRYGEMDDFIVSRMLLCGIPLNESYLQYRLSVLMKEERKALKGGRIPISDSYYLMGTADPTGCLEADEVCIILSTGQVSGKVLVYRTPGYHFGDVHVLKATYVEKVESIVGNGKYGILFPTKGPRSLADELAGGDFDGDMYWVSRNPQLLDYFQASEPWACSSPSKGVCEVKPTDYTPEVLEDEILQQFLTLRFNPSNCIGIAADSCLSLMDRLLTLNDKCATEKHCLKGKILKLIDVYYDALDAPKSGKKVAVPKELKVEKFPHFMERQNSYHSKSILGLIYDEVESFSLTVAPKEEVWMLPCFNRDVPTACKKLWKEHYDRYREEMTAVLRHGNESKNCSADAIIEKYKQILYGAGEFEESVRNEEDIFNEALAIYQITYEYAKGHGVEKCGFVWRVAGRALCKLHAREQDRDNIVCVKSVLREVLK